MLGRPSLAFIRAILNFRDFSFGPNVSYAPGNPATRTAEFPVEPVMIKANEKWEERNEDRKSLKP